MSYIEEVMAEIRRRVIELELGREPDDFLQFVRYKIAESFKNGMQAQERARQAKRAANR